MHHRNILYVSYTTNHHDMMRVVSSGLDVSTLLATPESFGQAVKSGHDFDLIVIDDDGMSKDFMSKVDEYVIQNGLIPILFVEEESHLSATHFPVLVPTDFVLVGASQAEFQLRIARLLWPNEESASSDIITVDNMTINLATYQVTIDGKPVDLTLMEYSLLSFLATHPGRAYTRETLLHRVWGFEYCGGTRTVDVHIRRVRSKVGPQVASHFETVRGVGYMFKQ